MDQVLTESFVFDFLFINAASACGCQQRLAANRWLRRQPVNACTLLLMVSESITSAAPEGLRHVRRGMPTLGTLSELFALPSPCRASRGQRPL
jgi:hypothetical protein